MELIGSEPDGTGNLAPNGNPASKEAAEAGAPPNCSNALVLMGEFS